MKLPGASRIATLLLATLVVSTFATIASLLVFTDVRSLDGSPPQRGFAAMLAQFSDIDTFVVFVLPQFFAFAVVSLVSMLVAAAIGRRESRCGARSP